MKNVAQLVDGPANPKSIGRLEKMGRWRVAMICIAALPLCIGGTASSQQPRKSELPLIEKTVLPEDILGQQFGATVNLGDLTAGKEYRVRINIQNPTNSLMRFKQLTKSCSCFDAQVSGLVIEPEGSLTVELTAPVPVKMGRPESQWRFSLERDAQPAFGGIHVRLNYSIAGLVEFLERRVVFESRAANANEVFLIPMLLTSPVEPGNLHFHFSKELSGMTGHLIKQNDRHFLQVTLDSAAVGNRYLAGEFGCLDTLTGRDASVYCVVKKSNGASVHPGILRVVKPTDDHTVGHAVAIIRVPPSTATGAAGLINGEKATSVLIDVMFEDELLPLEFEQLSASTYRAKINFPDATLIAMKKSPRPGVRWIIRDGQSAHEIASRISIPESH